jgi:hypothetical protein
LQYKLEKKTSQVWTSNSPNGCRSSGRLGLLDIVGSEEKLPVEVGLLNQIHVRHKNVALRPGTNAGHGKVFQKLTADGAGANDEVAKGAQLLLELVTQHGHLRGIAIVGHFVVLDRSALVRKALLSIKVQELLDWHKLAAAALHHLLSYDAANLENIYVFSLAFNPCLVLFYAQLTGLLSLNSF